MLSKWDSRYLEMAKLVASWSKDPSRKIGAVAIGKKGQVLSQGYNGFPRGIEDSHYRYNNREEKYRYVVHAEMNCIYNAGWNGVSLNGSTVYIDGLPCCHECAKGLIQVGVKRVIARYEDEQVTPIKWAQSELITKQLFTEAGVKYESIV